MKLVSDAAANLADSRVEFQIEEELARLALIAADCFRRLPPREAAKAKTVLQSTSERLRPTAKNLKEICALVGFVFAMKLDEARLKRVQEEKEQAGASDDVETN